MESPVYIQVVAHRGFTVSGQTIFPVCKFHMVVLTFVKMGNGVLVSFFNLVYPCLITFGSRFLVSSLIQVILNTCGL